MSFSTTLSLQYSIHNNNHRKRSIAFDQHPLQFVELRLKRSTKLMSPSTHQIIQQTSPTLISDSMFYLPLSELEEPPFVSHYFFHQILSPFNLPPGAAEAIFDKIASFALGLAGGNINLNFHIIANVDLVYMLWQELDPQDSWPAMKGAPASVIKRLMKEKYDGNGGEEVGDECSVCYEDLQFHGEKEKEKEKEKEVEVSRLGCGHAYHKLCIIKWVSINNSCPLCRKELEE